MQMHTSLFFASTTYSLNNFSILSVTSLSDPIPFFYSADSIREFLEVGFYETTDNQITENTILLNYIVNYISNEVEDRSALATQLQILRDIFVLPFYCVNFISTNNDIGTGYYAKSVYRLIISDFSLYTFTAMAAVAVLWCACALVYCLTSSCFAPNSSQYPEIDFASRCITVPDGSRHMGMNDILNGLGNSSTTNIENSIKGKKAYVGAQLLDGDISGCMERVVLATGRTELQGLKPRQKYI